MQLLTLHLKIILAALHHHHWTSGSVSDLSLECCSCNTFTFILLFLPHSPSASLPGGEELLKSTRRNVWVSLGLSDSWAACCCPGFPGGPDRRRHSQQQHLPAGVAAAEREPALPREPERPEPLVGPPGARCDGREAAGETRRWRPGAGASSVPAAYAALRPPQLPPPQAEDGAVSVWHGPERSGLRLQVPR